MKAANRERIQNDPPERVMVLPDLSQHDLVCLGYQTWTMILSQPMRAFLLQYGSQFSNKKIAPFLSEGGYGPVSNCSMKLLLKMVVDKSDAEVEI
ncbi:flavodoxin family protein [Lactobacillus intestinalis]|uniref:Uncharacterized protein n=1 Tax=Lactobacillus intestinalis DSM 6629 TaxID=1423761 RepID=A0ABR5PPM3_9LACO|nr:hypothetical protein [Lactobacillus intestinalis]KRM31754.1 hypothetical protein FC44_GL000453 [Lactobacillus intestinalis DSM 6629]UTW41233.1 hypothetical protein KBW87_08970 [Lactobacillus intestinalis]